MGRLLPSPWRSHGQLEWHGGHPGQSTSGGPLSTGMSASWSRPVLKERLKAEIHVPSHQGYPQQVLFIDLVGLLPETPASNRYILTCQN